MRSGSLRGNELGSESVEQAGGEVGVDRVRKVAGDRPEHRRHPSRGLLGEREQHRRVGLVVEKRDLLDATIRHPSEPTGVRPEEGVEVSELVGMNGRPFAEEARERVPVAELDDGHG